MGGGLKLAGIGFAGLGAVVLVSLIVSMFLNDDFSQAPGLVIPALFCAAGVGLWRLGRLNEADAGFDLGHIGRWVFLSVGSVMLIGGVIVSFDDPGGLFLVFMGAVFCGAGWFAGRFFATPEGKKKVFMEEANQGYRSRTDDPSEEKAALDAFSRVLAGISDPERPILTKMLLGPTGVGKTETVP